MNPSTNVSWMIAGLSLIFLCFCSGCPSAGRDATLMENALLKNQVEELKQSAENLTNELNGIKANVEVNPVIDSLAKFEDALVKLTTSLSANVEGRVASDDNQAGRDITTNPVTYVDGIQAIWPPLLLGLYILSKRFPMIRGIIDSLQNKPKEHRI